MAIQLHTRGASGGPGLQEQIGVSSLTNTISLLKLRNYLALCTCENAVVYIVKYLRETTQGSVTSGIMKLNHYAQHADILQCRLTNAVTNKKKKQIWDDIAMLVAPIGALSYT